MLDISLVVCTRNRSAQLRDALDRLSALRPSISSELVFVDNGSTDDTAAVLEQFRLNAPWPCTVVYEGKPGLGRARNQGWRASSGAIVAFTDDDCYPADDFLDRVVECFADSSLGFLGGRILLFDPTDLPITIQPLERRVELLPGKFISAGLIQGANFALRRTTLEAIGGFDDGFGAGTPFPCEDVDVIARASGRGWKGAYDPRPLVFHHHRRKTQQDALRLMYGYDIGRGAYYVKSILDQSLRLACLKVWARMVLTQSPVKTLRELKGGAGYLMAMRRNRVRSGNP